MHISYDSFYFTNVGLTDIHLQTHRRSRPRIRTRMQMHGTTRRQSITHDSPVQERSAQEGPLQVAQATVTSGRDRNGSCPQQKKTSSSKNTAKTLMKMMWNSLFLLRWWLANVSTEFSVQSKLFFLRKGSSEQDSHSCDKILISLWILISFTSLVKLPWFLTVKVLFPFLILFLCTSRLQHSSLSIYRIYTTIISCILLLLCTNYIF